jgi:regulator of cell morphogenesis and NO signaling
MMNANQSIAQITIDVPSAAVVFDRMGIAYCCEGWKSLKSACSELGLPVDDVIRTIERESKPDKNGSRASAKTFEFLILRVLEAQHEELRRALPPLEALAATAVERNRAKHPELLVIEELLQSLSSDLAMHLAEEERNLFPYLLQLELAYLGENPISGYPRRVRDILRSMSQQHDTSVDTLRRIYAESHGFCSPVRADASFHAFYDGLQKFFGDMHRDLHLENNILFPQAAQMEADVFRGFRTGSC